MNQITIAGHLGADPEVRFTPSGLKVTVLRVAARARRSSKDKDDTIWWRVTIWGDQFDRMIPHFKKGSPIIVFGELNKPEIFNDREGRPQISLGITALNLQFSPFGRPDNHSSDSSENSSSKQSHEMAFASGGQSEFGQGQGKGHDKEKEGSFSDDEIPF